MFIENVLPTNKFFMLSICFSKLYINFKRPGNLLFDRLSSKISYLELLFFITIFELYFPKLDFIIDIDYSSLFPLNAQIIFLNIKIYILNKI